MMTPFRLRPVYTEPVYDIPVVWVTKRASWFNANNGMVKIRATFVPKETPWEQTIP
jgi:hypothetical protein